MSKHVADLRGQRFGRLVAEEYQGVNRHGHALWLCKCDCGNTKIVTACGLKTDTQSCGCLHKERFRRRIHGGTSGGRHERLHNIWRGMRERCNNPRNISYKWYGQKGVKVCREWQDDYAAFREWAITNGYSDSLTIDRIDSNGNYEPNNCRWLTQAENARRAARKEKHDTTDTVQKS